MGGKHEYFVNSLTSWKAEMLAEQRRALKRLDTMRTMNHPDAEDQARLMDINLGFIDTIEGLIRDTQSKT